MDSMALLGGYRDRVARIALFDVFHQLENKQQTDDQQQPIDFFGIGLLSLLYFFESMLNRNSETGIDQLADFLESNVGSEVTLTSEGFRNLAKQIVEIFRPTSGKRLNRKFFNYETGEYDEFSYQILKATGWDQERQIQYYSLGEEGLELIFATKEYFSEFQISISQMLLRKQLEKGEFNDALRQVDEMRINVQTIRDKIHKLKHEIQRNIISEETYQRYKDLISDINLRLIQEQGEFEALMVFIRETKTHLDIKNVGSQKDQDAISAIIRVDNELASVHYMHANLLNESIELKTTAVEAAGESLYLTGITSFNFDQEISRYMLGKPIPFMESKALAAPFLPLEHFTCWSLLTVFEPHYIDRQDHRIKESFLNIKEDLIEEDTHIRQKYMKEVGEFLRNYIEEMNVQKSQKGTYTLQLSALVEGNMDAELLHKLLIFGVIGHQMSPLLRSDIIKQNSHLFYEFFIDFKEPDTKVSVKETGEELMVDQYILKDLMIELGGA